MKVILTQELEMLGREGDTVAVADGYANNFLIPRGLAVRATPGNVRQWQDKRASVERKEVAERLKAQEFASGIEGAVIQISARTGESGRLYGSITAKDVVNAVEKQLNIKLDKRRLDLGEGIRELGSHSVAYESHPGIKTSLTVDVTAMGKEEVAAKAEPAGMEVAEAGAEASEAGIEAAKVGAEAEPEGGGEAAEAGEEAEPDVEPDTEAEQAGSEEGETEAESAAE